MQDPNSVFKKKVIKRTIILVGHTGCGKSRLANFLLGENHFKVSKSLGSVTQGIEVSEKSVRHNDTDLLLRVVDTQGLADTTMTDDEVMRIVKDSLAKGVTKVHYFVIMVQRGRLTTERRDAIEKLISEFQLEERKSNVLFCISNCEMMSGKALSELHTEYMKDRTSKKIFSELKADYPVDDNFIFIGLPEESDCSDVMLDGLRKIQIAQRSNLLSLLQKNITPIKSVPRGWCNIL